MHNVRVVATSEGSLAVRPTIIKIDEPNTAEIGPDLFFNDLFPIQSVGFCFQLNSRSKCSLLHSKSSYVYIFTVVVLLPSAVLVLAYGTIIVTVLRRQWSDRANVRMTSALSESADDKKENSYSRINARLIVMCAIITVLFMFCWYPTLLLIYLRRYNGVVLSAMINDYIRVAYYFHPMLNPLVYFFVDPRFRSIAVRLFWPKKVDNDNISMASATQVETAHD